MLLVTWDNSHPYDKSNNNAGRQSWENMRAGREYLRYIGYDVYMGTALRAEGLSSNTEIHRVKSIDDYLFKQ